MPGKSILLLLCTFFVLVLGWSITPAQAHCQPTGKHSGDHPHCRDTEEPTLPCEINFCIEFDDGHEVTHDGEPEYCHGTEKVLAFTGKGPGFRFDTNRSKKLEGAGGFRKLNIDLRAFEATDNNELLRPFNSADKGIDLRFDKSDVGLDLCFDGAITGSGTVPLTISFEVPGATDNTNTLTYGAPAGIHSCGDPVTVTLTTNPEEWTIVGGDACLWDGAFNALVFKGELIRENLDGPADASFSAVLTRN